VQRQYVNTWTDAGVAGTASEAMVGGGADVIFSATDQATQGIFKTMQERPDHYVIAQYNDKNEQAPDVVLTSVLYGLDTLTGSFIEDAAEGDWTSENATVTVADGIELAPYHGLEQSIPAEVQDAVAQVVDGLASGDLTLPGMDVLGTTGAADEIDLATIGDAPTAQ
jgi:basic membrane protein A